MKKSAMRALSVLLALVMLLGMTASAQISRITFNLNGPDGLSLDGILSAGYDEDGCEQYVFENSQIGKWVLQSDGMSLVAGGDQAGYYAVTADDLAAALTNVITAIVSEELGDEFFNVINYLNSAAFEEDAYMAGQILGSEANRFAYVAQSMGLVTIHENGDLEINCTLAQVFELISAYLNSLAADENVLSAFADLAIFKALGVPMKENAAQLPEILKNAADQVAASKAEAVSAMDGSLNLYINAQTGEMSGKYYAATMQNGETLYSVTETFVIGQTSYEYESVTIANGGEIKEIVRSNGNGMYVYYGASAAGQMAEFEVDINSFGLNAKMAANTNELSGEGNLVINDAGIKGECDFAGANLSLVGEISYDPISEEFLMKVDSVDGADSAKITCEYADDELYAELFAIENGDIIANITVSGSNTYRVNGSWKVDYVNYLLNATLRMKNEGAEIEGTLQISEIMGGRTTCAFGYAENRSKRTEEAYATVTSGSVKTNYELKSVKAGDIETVSMNVITTDGTRTNKVEATVDIDYAGKAVIASWMLDENGDKLPGSFCISKDLIEVRFARNGMSYRIYAENRSANSEVSLVAGVSGVQDSDPDTLLDAILFTFKASNANGLNFEAILNTMIGYFASAAFDGQTLKVDVTANGNTATFEGKLVETENGAHILVTGFVNGQALEGKLGLEMKDAATICLFMEASVNGQTVRNEVRFIQSETGVSVEVSGDNIAIDGEKLLIKAGANMETEETVLFFGELIGELPEHVMGVYLPVTVVEDYDSVSVSGVLTVRQGDQQMEIGNANFKYEELNESLRHVAGTPLSADDLTAVLLQLLFGGSY